MKIPYQKGEHSCMQMYRAVTQTERGNLLVYEKKWFNIISCLFHSSAHNKSVRLYYIHSFKYTDA